MLRLNILLFVPNFPYYFLDAIAAREPGLLSKSLFLDIIENPCQSTSNVPPINSHPSPIIKRRQFNIRIGLNYLFLDVFRGRMHIMITNSIEKAQLFCLAPGGIRDLMSGGGASGKSCRELLSVVNKLLF